MTSITASAHSRQAPMPLSGRRASLALVVVLLAAFMDLLDVTIVAVAAPALTRSLSATSAQLQWVVAAYALALGSGLITGGRLGDDYGRRRVFLVSLAGFALGSAACALAPTIGVLLAMRVLQGLAGGFMVPQVFGIIRASFAPQAMGRAFGAYGAVQGLASVAGPLLGGLLVDADLWGLGWRTIFWVNIPVAIAALVLGARVLPESTADGRARLDVLGAALSAAAVVLILLPIVQGRDWGWPVWGWGVLAAGVGLLGVFLAWERKLAANDGAPLFDPRLLLHRAFSVGLAVALLFFGAIAAFFLVLSIYLQVGTGRSAFATGLVTLPYAVGSIVTSGVGVALAGRAGRALLITGALLLAAAQALLWLLVQHGGSPGFCPLAGVMLLGGLGLGLAAPILVNVILAGVPGRHAGSAGGVLSTVNQIGGAIGIAALGTLFFNAIRPGPPAVAFGRALGAVLPWQVAAYVAAALLMIALPRTTAPQSQTRH